MIRPTGSWSGRGMDSSALRIARSSTPRLTSARRAEPSGRRRSPRRKWWVAMYARRGGLASSCARTSARFPSSLNASKGYLCATFTKSALWPVNEHLFVDLGLVKMGVVGNSLDLFAPATRDWFRGSFDSPPQVHERGSQEGAAGRPVLMAAPTGRGKARAAFLWCPDRPTTQPGPAGAERWRGPYASPPKALPH